MYDTKINPKELSASGSVPASGTLTLSIQTKQIFLKTLKATVATSTVTNIKVNGIDITPATDIDFISVYGDMPTIGSVEVSFSNSGSSAETVSISLFGVVKE